METNYLRKRRGKKGLGRMVRKGTNLIETLNAVGSPVVTGEVLTPEQLEEGARKVFEECIFSSGVAANSNSNSRLGIG